MDETKFRPGQEVQTLAGKRGHVLETQGDGRVLVQHYGERRSYQPFVLEAVEDEPTEAADERPDGHSVWVVIEHDAEEGASEVVAVIHDDSEAALAVLWDAYHRAWSYMDSEREAQPRTDEWYEEHADRLTLEDDGTARLELAETDQVWRAERHEVR